MVQEDLSIDTLGNHFDFRPIAAFFLGWLFLYSVHFIIYSQFVHKAFCCLWYTCRHLFSPVHSQSCSGVTTSHPEPISAPPGKTTGLNHYFVYHRSDRDRKEDQILVLILAICFANASIALFFSLLHFSVETACAFLVALGGMAAHAARLAGLLILGGHLRQLGIRLPEICVFWAMLVVTLGVIFADTAIGVGRVEHIWGLGISKCDERHFMPFGLASSILLILLDVYVIARVWTLANPNFLRWWHQFQIFADSRIQRALSLLFLEAMTVTSSIIRTNILADIIPFSVGGMIVLAAFNSHMELDVGYGLVHFSESRRSSIWNASSTTMASTTSRRSLSTYSGLSFASPTSSNKPIRELHLSLDSGDLGSSIQILGRHVRDPQHSRAVTRIPSTVETPRQELASLPRPILKTQVQYAERLSQEQSLLASPWKKHCRPRVSISVPDNCSASGTEKNGSLSPEHPAKPSPSKSSTFGSVPPDRYFSRSNSRFSYHSTGTCLSRHLSHLSSETLCEEAATDLQQTPTCAVLRQTTFGQNDADNSSRLNPSDAKEMYLDSTTSLPLSAPSHLASYPIRHGATPAGPRQLPTRSMDLK